MAGLALHHSRPSACSSTAPRSSLSARRMPVVLVKRTPARPSIRMRAQPLSTPTPAPAANSAPGLPPHTDTVWLQEKLNESLAGLVASTRRTKVRALRVLHVTGARMSYSPTHRPRCTGLDLDIAWEAEPSAASLSSMGGASLASMSGALEPLHGMARVKLTTRGGDKVQVTDVQVLEDDEAGEGGGAPCMPSGKAAPPDVLLAVQSLDGTIMEHLNSFMWELEQAEAGQFPLSSFELDEDSEGGSASATRTR